MEKIKSTKKGRKRKLSLYQSRHKKSQTYKLSRRQKIKVSEKWYTTQKSPSETEEYSDSEVDDVDIECSLDDDKSFEYNVSYSDHEIFNQSHSVQEDLDTDTPANYLEKCVSELLNESMWKRLTQKLSENGILKDFMTLSFELDSGNIPMDNIVLLLLLERARFGQIKNTVGMRYRHVTKLFWSILYRLCRSTGLKFFSGSKNWGQVVSEESHKSRYRGSTSKINFAVPDEKVLRNLNNKLPKIIPPGIIHKAMDMLTDEKDIILMADGKMISKGLGDHFTGDIDLFGHEINPNLNELRDDLENHLNIISKNIFTFQEATISDQYFILCETC